ncbi:MAG: YpdA family putative bacillithiol disulfide reductase [bacterium]
MTNYDVIIIGAGPIGLACGIHAAKLKLSHLIVEKGCIVNSIYQYPTNMTFFSTSEKLEIGDVPFISHGVKPTRTEALEYYRRVKESWKLNVNTYEKVISISGKKGKFSVETEKGEYQSKNIIIASGFFDFPNLLNIPGEELPKVKHYYDEPHPYAGQKVIVVGGGNSAVDVALETFRRGAEVTMVVRESKLKGGIKYWVKPDIKNRIVEGSIKAYFKSVIKEIRSDEVDIQTPKQLITVKNDFVLAMTGYHPDYSLLKQAGVKISDDKSFEPVYNSETFETNVKGVFLAGVVCGGINTSKWFIENSREHAEKIFNHLKK